MPPGQSATLNTADAPGSSGIAQRSASREVWNIAEVRGRILRLLEKPELAVMMRVEKKAVYDVARELYATVTYSKAKNNMSVSTVSLSQLTDHMLIASSVKEPTAQR